MQVVALMDLAIVILHHVVFEHYKRKLDPRRKDGFVKMMEQMERRNEMLYTTRLSEEEELRMAGF